MGLSVGHFNEAYKLDIFSGYQVHFFMEVSWNYMRLSNNFLCGVISWNFKNYMAKILNFSRLKLKIIFHFEKNNLQKKYFSIPTIYRTIFHRKYVPVLQATQVETPQLHFVHARPRVIPYKVVLVQAQVVIQIVKWVDFPQQLQIFHKLARAQSNR